MNPARPLAATTDFGLRREAKRHAAFGSNRQCGKRCRRCALPPQSKSLSSVREVTGLYYGWTRIICRFPSPIQISPHQASHQQWLAVHASGWLSPGIKFGSSSFRISLRVCLRSTLNCFNTRAATPSPSRSNPSRMCSVPT